MSFTWIPLYAEIARKVLEFEHRQDELIALLRSFAERGQQVVPLEDKDAQNNRFPLTEIDPFTFFATFNWQGRKPEKRRAILAALQEEWQLTAPVPEDFDGIPLGNRQNLWLFAFQKQRDPDDIPRLWQLARQVVGGTRATLDRDLVLRVLKQRTVGAVKLSIGMFWLNPREFLAADKWTRGYMERRGVPEDVFEGDDYFTWLDACVEKAGTDFPALSLAAYVENKSPEAYSGDERQDEPATDGEDDVEPETPEVTEEQGIEFVRYFGPLLDAIRSLGGAATAKAATAKVAEILQLEPEKLNELTKGKGGIPGELRFPKNVAFARFYLRNEGMIEPLTPQTRGIWKLTKLGRETRLDIAQAREIFLRHARERADRKSATVGEAEPATPEAQRVALFTKADALDGLFMDAVRLDTILERLTRKKALILQGPPGVGKTFIARRLAYALMGERDDSRVVMVQFHPSYGYEDFIQGYRPDGSGLRLRHGVFFEFARRARNDPAKRPWFFIIDEINRGNLAKIFGELLMLIEADKRGPEHAVPLTYSDGPDDTFYLPENLHVIGTMNTADRSLAMVDYALRRRFAFVTLDPALDSPAFAGWLGERGAPASLIGRICDRVREVNAVIEAERDLGCGFRIGHSFFCPANGHTPDEAWYREVIGGEIQPLLEEYFDSRDRVEKLVSDLLAP